ncbi:MAG: TolC family protein [Mariprofundaceae bacterium]|nr:TolC family protein [Mariprofundaceae bacterium]
MANISNGLKKVLCRLFVYACMLLAQPAQVLAESINLSQVLRGVLQEQPSLALAALNESVRRIDDMQRQSLLDATWGVAFNGSDEKKPSPSPFGSNITNLGVLSVNIRKPLANGATLSTTLNYSRTRLRYPASTASIFQSSMNPIYENKIDVIYRYPLWQGHNNPSYHGQARINAEGVAVAHWNVIIQQEQLLAQGIAAYYQLAANEISLRIADDAVHRVALVLRYQRKREAFGLVEAADRLQTEALLATRKATRVQANAALQSSRTALMRLLLKKQTASPLHADTRADINLLPSLLRTDRQLLESAKKRRPVFRMLHAQIAGTEATSSILEDRLRPELNLIGQVGSRALSGLNARTTNDSFDLRDRFIGVGIEFKDTIGKHATKAALARNALQREQAVLEQWQAIEQIRTEIANAHTDLENSQQNYRALQGRMNAEQKKYNAEINRYQEGRSDTATITQFSGDLRAAELQAALQKINIDLARARLLFAAGDFLPTTENLPITEKH